MPIKEAILNGRRGQIAAFPYESYSKLADVATIAGVFVCDGAAQESAKVVASAANVQDALGVTAYLPSRPIVDGVNEYEAGDEMTIISNGRIFTVSEEAMSKDDDVYVRHTAKGGNTALGAVRSGPDANAAVFSVTETDANVDNGTYEVHYRINDGDVLVSRFAASSTAHAALAAGLETAIEADSDVDVAVAAEADDAIQVTLTTATDDVVHIVQLVAPSTGTVLAVETQGAGTCERLPQSKVIKATSAAGVVELRFIRPQ